MLSDTTAKLRLSSVLAKCNMSFLCLALMFFLIPCAPSSAQESPIVQSRRLAVQEEENNLGQMASSLEKRRVEIRNFREKPSPEPVTDLMLQEARLTIDAAQIQLESISLDKQTIARTVQELTLQIEELRSTLKSLRLGAAESMDEEKRQAAETVEAELAEKKALLKLEKRHEINVERRRELVAEQLKLEQSWLELLQTRFQRQQEEKRKVALDELEASINEKQKILQVKAAELRERFAKLGDDASVYERRFVKARIKEAEESIYLLQVELKRAQIRSRMGTLRKELELYEDDAKKVQGIVTDLKKVAAGLDSTRTLTRRKISVMSQQLEVMEKRRPQEAADKRWNRQEQEVTRNLFDRFGKELYRLDILYGELSPLLERAEAGLQKKLQAGLSVRYTPPLDLILLREIAGEIAFIPARLGQLLHDAWLDLMAALEQPGTDRRMVLFLLIGLWVLGWTQLYRLFPKKEAKDLQAESFTRKFVFVMGALLRENRYELLVAGLITLAGWIGEIDPARFTVIMAAATLWLSSSFIVGFAEWFLLTPLVRKLYWQRSVFQLIQRSVTVGAILVFFLLLGHYEFLSDPLHDLFRLIFMVFLAVVTFFALQVRVRVVRWLRAVTVAKRWFQLVRVVSLLFFSSMLGASILGLAGWLNLAWAVAFHLVWFFVVVFCWYIVRGLFIDMVRHMKSYAVEHSEIGLFWAQGIIDPLQFIVRIVLVIVALAVLFRIYGWYGDHPAIVAIEAGFSFPLFSIGSVDVNLTRILGVVASVAFLFWSARWVRQFTYRWIYAGILDTGVRNTLAVFTQYLFVLAGLLIAINLMGLDLTSVAILTGAVGVGIGFGMQNIANNFISGIILLLERPLRTKDLVTVSGIDGEVTNIGIRSVTVNTWDNQEVIIPNADIISNPFTNWTRGDNMVRTVMYVGVSYHDNPYQAHRVMEKAVVS
ncbi:MAG: mechanosensitive ion channel domain-containing protein, partial [Pseudomonadota bacterium]